MLLGGFEVGLAKTRRVAAVDTETKARHRAA